MKTSGRILPKLILILGILGLAVFVIFILVITKPEPTKKADEEILPEVEVAKVEPGAIEIEVPSQGMVMPRRRTVLASEVMGKIVEVSPKFDAGQSFAEGEVIARIEDADYRSILSEARVALAQAEVDLATERARAEQAQRDLRTLGNSGKPSDLTLRKPQLAAAEVRIESAREAIAKAARDLERTTIRAPYDGVVASVQTELGTYVSPGVQILEIFSPSPFEVRLPVSLDEYRFVKKASGEPAGKVTFLAQAGNELNEWTGKIIRGEGEIERQSRSLYLVAEVADDDSGEEGIQLQPGLFVRAAISGRKVEGLTQVPSSAFLDLDRVVVVDPEDRIQYRTVQVVRRQSDSSLIAEGLEPTDRIVLTELSGRIPGMKVKPITVDLKDQPEQEALTRAVKP